MPRAHKKRDRPWPTPRLGPHRGSCAGGKICYETRSDANRAITQLRHNLSRRTYLHQDCGYWHLTSQREVDKPPLAVRPVRPGPSLPPDLMAPTP